MKKHGNYLFVILVSIGLLLGVVIISDNSQKAQATNIEALQTSFSTATNTETPIVEINGIPIGRKLFDKQKAAINQAASNKDSKALDKETFNILRKVAVAEAEVQRRNIVVSQDEASAFTNSQRKMVEQAPKDSQAYKVFKADMQTLGFTDPNQYWAYMEKGYAQSLKSVKLREQVGKDAGAKTYEEVWKAYEDYINKLDSSATIVYLDKSLETSIKS